MTDRLHSPREFQAYCERLRAKGKRVGFVPTMGALHEGHLSLVDCARKHGATAVAVSVFVNPLQFGPSEDFNRYPRTLDEDVRACEGRAVDVVFAPSPADMYPKGFSTSVEVSGVTEPLEGRFRPGHFRGVATVVAKLFVLAGPCVAVFGRKDYQQWRVLHRMVSDMDLPVEMIGMPTVRESDGLALSSRNRYLTSEERARALAISRGLRAAHEQYRSGLRDPATLESIVVQHVERNFDSVDYISAADPTTLGPVEGSDRILIAVAARIGSTRLIDNTVLGEDVSP